MSKPHRNYQVLSQQQKRFINEIISYMENEVEDGEYHLLCWNDKGEMMHSVYRGKSYMLNQLNNVVDEGRYGSNDRITLQCIRYHIVGKREPFRGFLG